jgi:hypothetical protein
VVLSGLRGALAPVDHLRGGECAQWP